MHLTQMHDRNASRGNAVRDDQGIHNIRVFVSSPGDVPVERERVDHVATRLNELFKDRIRIETIRWEKDFYSSHQHFADKIPRTTDADLVIAIFWSRLGTPLPIRFGRMDNGERYPSGTAYEVLTAIDARRKNDHPDVYVFRKDEAPPIPRKKRRRSGRTSTASFRDGFGRPMASTCGPFISSRPPTSSNGWSTSCCASGSPSAFRAIGR
jgi:hypothetical protein